MLKFSMIQLEVLKKEVLGTAGITSITPAGCKALSIELTHVTSQRISETTLKRIYGFALSKFKPSLFTIDVLSKYCGYTGWADFCLKQQGPVPLDEEDINWETLKQNAGKISHFTLQALKNRSGIPYGKTIKRAFADTHLNNFISSGYPCTVLAAPAGYGKTIALCHWIAEKPAINTAEKHGDIFLFFSSSALMGLLLSDRDINHWMLGLLGYSNDKDINALFDPKPKQGNFYLVIDGFDEHMINGSQFRAILSQLMDMIGLHRYDSWFKLILTMRTATWLNYRNEFDSTDNLWYTNFEDEDSCVNVPLLDVEEVKELCRNINPSVHTPIPMDVAQNFSHPLFLQFYYKQHRDNFALSDAGHFCIYDVVASFMLNNVYLGRYSSEKTLLINALVAEMDLDNRQYKVDMLKGGSLVRTYQQAYNELLSIGFLKEENHSDDHGFNTGIVFGNDNFLEYSLAKNLQYPHNGKFTPEFVASFQRVYGASVHKLGVLKWCIINAVKTGHQESFGLLTAISLTPDEKSELIIFLGDLFDNECGGPQKNEQLLLYFKQDFNEKMFDYFFGLKLINVQYQKTLYTLFKFELSDKEKLLVYTALGITAVMSVEMDQLAALLDKLRGFDKMVYAELPINPLECLQAIYNYFKYGTLDDEAMLSLTKLVVKQPANGDDLQISQAEEMLYILGTFALALSHHPQRSTLFLDAINEAGNDDDQQAGNTQRRFFSRMMEADIYFETCDRRRAANIYREILTAYGGNVDGLSPLMRAFFANLKMKTLIIEGRAGAIAEAANSTNLASANWGNKLSKLYLTGLLLRNEQLFADYPEFKKQLHLYHTKMIKENDLYPQLFLHRVEV